MAPKKKNSKGGGKGGNDGQGSSQVPAAIVEVNFVDNGTTHPANIEYLDKLNQAWSTIVSHPVFENVSTMAPYEIEAC